MKETILVAGIGNIFWADDGFGVHVIHSLVQRQLPPNVKVVDFGIRGFDLAFSLLDGYEHVILVDALQKGYVPGTLSIMELSPEEITKRDSEMTSPMTHGMIPTRALGFALGLGAATKTLHLVGCEPASFGDESEGGLELSKPVAAAVEGAIAMIKSLIQKFQPCMNSV